MAVTSPASGSQVQKWERDVFMEYVRESGFKPYMRSSPNAVINVKDKIIEGGNTINIPIIDALSGSGAGTGTLAGNEVAFSEVNHQITVETKRQAVVFSEDSEHDTEYSMMGAAKPLLKDWCKAQQRSEILEALGSVGGVAYGSATEAQKDAWVDANTDRVLFGASTSNLDTTAPAGGATYDHSGSLANVDSTNDKLNAALIRQMKLRCKTADPAIRPTSVNASAGREYFVLFAGSIPFKHAKEDSTINSASENARARDAETNPIFQDGDLIYDGVIIREIPEIATLGTVGASSINVQPVYMCGAQALGMAWAKKPVMTRRADDDYGYLNGIGIYERYGVSKIVRTDVDWGMHTAFVSGEA